MTAEDKKWLSAAECAARTGVTVRALRVYEREGLLRPPRSSSGWRRYGTQELQRLNVIVALKALGLTLAQIRRLLAENALSLSQSLQMQCESLKTKVVDAEHVLALATAANRRLQSHQELSLHELCELVTSLDTGRRSVMRSYTTFVRDLMKELLNPEEQDTWDIWWATHPEDAAQNLAFLRQRYELYGEMHDLIDRKVEPSAVAAQSLLERHNALVERYGFRQRTVRMLEWNAGITTKFMSMGTEVRTRNPTAEHLPYPLVSQKLAEYFEAASWASPLSAELTELLVAVKRLLKSEVNPGTAAAEDCVQRMCALCAKHGLGDPYVYARFTPFLARVNRFEMSAEDEAAWGFLARAFQFRQMGEPRLRTFRLFRVTVPMLRSIQRTSSSSRPALPDLRTSGSTGLQRTESSFFR